MKPVTQNQLAAWNQAYETDDQRQLAALALSKGSMSNAALVTSKSGLMRQKFSVNIETLEVAAKS